MLNPVFGKISYRPLDYENEIMFTVMVTSVGENWKTGVAIDASTSMKGLFGKNFLGHVPPHALAEYKKKGWANRKHRDGKTLLVFEKEAYEDAIDKKYLKFTNNIVEQEGRKFIDYLASRLDADGEVSVIYWACGEGGNIEKVGDIPAGNAGALELRGPNDHPFGEGSKLLPALTFFEKKFRYAPKAMFIFITDGFIDDIDDVKTETITLAGQIREGIRNPVKCVLIGIGDKIDENQMIELDDLDADIDIWDYKMASDMRMIEEIFAELADESVIVTASTTIYDDAGNIVARFTDGLPGRVVFRMPKHSRFFELEVGGRERIRQSIFKN